MRCFDESSSSDQYAFGWWSGTASFDSLSPPERQNVEVVVACLREQVKDSRSLCVRSRESCIQNGLISGTPTCRVPILPVGLRGYLILT